MSNDINILLYKGSVDFKEQQRIKIVRRIAFVLSVIIGISSVVIFFFILYLDPAAIKKSQGEIKGQIARYEERKGKLFIVNSRIQNIKDILVKRKNYAQDITILMNQMPSGLSVEDMQMDNESFSITVSSSSLIDIGVFIDNLIDMAKKKELISSLILDSLTFDEEKNSYLVSLQSKF